MTTDADLLATGAFLQALGPDERAALAANGTEVQLRAGQRLFSEGEQGDALYIVRGGQVALTFSGDGRDICLETIGPGGVVGEIALFSPGPRTATATASTDLDALRIERAHLEQLLLAYPRVPLALLEVLGARLRATDQRVQHRDGTIPRWPALIAIVALGLLFLFLPERYTVGPRWTVLVIMLILLVPLIGSRRLGYHRMTHFLALGVPLLLTLAVASSALLLLIRLPSGGTDPLTLLREAGLIWMANIVTFALWYWELDGGGPTVRHPGRHASTDFAFPQQQQDDDGIVEGWSPGFFDYLFLAFNASTAFSPTDTLVLSRRMKGLMMAQAILSLIVVGVLIARAVNTLGSP